jgi:hypothetical protein
VATGGKKRSGFGLLLARFEIAVMTSDAPYNGGEAVKLDDFDWHENVGLPSDRLVAGTGGG